MSDCTYASLFDSIPSSSVYEKLFEPEDQCDRLVDVLKYGKPSYDELTEIIRLGNRRMHKNPEKHLNVIYTAFYNYAKEVDQEFWQLCAPTTFFNAQPTLSMLSLLHQYSWTLEEFNKAILNTSNHI
jgi:hypothetical protein